MVLPRGLGVKGGGEIEDGRGCFRLNRHLRLIHGPGRGTDSRDGVRCLTTDEQQTAPGQAANVNHAVFMLLDDFRATAAASAAAKLVSGGKRGMSEDECGGGVRSAIASAGEEISGVVRDGGLKDARECDEGCEFHFQDGLGAQAVASAGVGSSSGEFSAAVRRRN